MILNKDCLAKGYYKHTQIANFISVKQYMFVRKKGKKCLIQRFSNDSDFVVNAIEYLVTELDAEGNVIRTDRVNNNGFTANPGCVFAPASGLVVSEECVDYKVRFISCISGRYKYLVKNGVPTPIYDRFGYARRDGSERRSVGEVTVSARRSTDRRLFAFITLIATVAIIAVAIVGVAEETARISKLPLPDEHPDYSDTEGGDSFEDEGDKLPAIPYDPV